MFIISKDRRLLAIAQQQESTDKFYIVWEHSKLMETFSVGGGILRLKELQEKYDEISADEFVECRHPHRK